MTENELKGVLSNFKVIPYNATMKILMQNLENKKKEDVLYIVAGPNGSGKSTLIANMYKNGYLDNVRYINADMIGKTLFCHTSPIEKRNKKAMYYTMDFLKNNVKKHKATIYETVMSHPSKLDIIKLYKANGFKICSIFICPNLVSVNYERVKQRVKEGGHDVSTEKITKRFEASNKLKRSLKELSDTYFEIDSTTERLKIIDKKIEATAIKTDI